MGPGWNLPQVGDGYFLNATKMFYYAPRPAERSEAGRGAFLFSREFKSIGTY